jgi:hypothetical protein
MDVDKEWTGPYWVTQKALLKSLYTLDSEKRQYRGYIVHAMCEFRFSLYGLCFSRAFYHVASWRKRRKFAHRVRSQG